MTVWRLISLLLLALFLGACSKKYDTVKAPYTLEDAEINAAMLKARESFPSFLTESGNPGSSGVGFMARVWMEKDGVGEELLLSNIEAREDHFVGVVADFPTKLTKLEMGDEVQFALHQVADWEYGRDGKIVGAYTRKVARSRMTPEERADYDALLPFAFE